MRNWFDQHLRSLEGLGWDEFRLMVIEGLERVKSPLGTGALAAALSEADRLPLPRWAARYAAPALQRIVRLCTVLQRNAGSEPFFLAGNSLAEELGITPGVAARWLRLLVRDGVLAIAAKGKRTKATEYIYIAKEADEDGPYRDRY